MIKQLGLLVIFFMITTNVLGQSVRNDALDAFKSIGITPDLIIVEDSTEGSVVYITYKNSIKDIRQAEELYYGSIIREIRNSMSNIYYNIYSSTENINRIKSAIITAKDSTGNNIIRTYFHGIQADRLNWMANKNIILNAIPEYWSTSMYSLKNEVWFDVPESVIINRFYK